LAIIIAAHGESAGVGDNRRLMALSSQVQTRFPDLSVSWALVNEPRSVAAAIERCADGRALILPALFSDGYFHEKLLDTVAGTGVEVAPPLALWPEFVEFLVANLPVGDPVLLVAHGSKRPGRSAASARELAAGLEAAGLDVRCGFLEEAPFAADVAAGMVGPFTLAGLFLGEGLHGGGDFAALAGLPGVRAALTVGGLDGLGDLFANRVREWLATMSHS
jgi:hypothetical protein